MSTKTIKVAEATNAQLDWLVADTRRAHRHMPLLQRIHVQSEPRENGCREWISKKNQHGYGVCMHEGKRRRAHRLLYFALHPDTPEHLVVMHTCDNPACVNPEHLVAGTVRDNMLDMHAKGRFGGGAKPGNKNAVGNKGWMKGGATAKYVTSKLGEIVEVPEELT